MHIRVVGKVSDRSIEYKLPPIKRMLVTVVCRHVNHAAFKAREFIIDPGVFPSFPVERHVHTMAFLEVLRLFSGQDRGILGEDVDLVLNRYLLLLVGLERAYTGKADTLPLALRDIDDSCAI